MTFSTPMKDATKNLTIDLDTTGPEGCGGDSVECVGGGPGRYWECDGATGGWGVRRGPSRKWQAVEPG